MLCVLLSRPKETLCNAINRESFPDDFQFGFSTSAYQVEGAADEDGRGLSIWDTFSSVPGKILGGGDGDVAADVYHLYKEDVQILKSLGTDVYRFSISWPRIFPGIEPMVTIFHWDVPQVLEDEYGGFRSKRILNDYSEFAEFCFRRYGDRVKKWVTINEPSIFATHGYQNGINAPGRCSPRYLDPIVFGDYPSSVKRLVGDRLPVFTKQESEAIKGSFDFIGVNHYVTLYVMDNATEEAKSRKTDTPDQVLPDSPDVPDAFAVTSSDKNGVQIGPSEGGVDYWRSYPQGIKLLLDYIRKNYYNPPMYITEIGYVTLDEGQPLINILQDYDRIRYIEDTLNYTLQAMRSGTNVRGFLMWSYIDNFEWDNGYPFRLGLYYVDYTDKNLQRIPKASADWFHKAMNRDSGKQHLHGESEYLLRSSS
ncbi:Beta-glucosidase 11 [Acorus gramineus]|uniref:Beta-glucosidase 11 n=1 Tax=Acorus gramineus TaxID=55184 RepID=A0AAV9AJQ2_ACOGR|nr:Beta-glucosidase 11 [Acorus gramineus]